MCEERVLLSEACPREVLARSDTMKTETSNPSSPIVVELPDEPWIRLDNLVRDNAFLGATLPQMLELLWRNKSIIEWRVFWARAVALVLVSAFNSLFAVWEAVVYYRAVRNAPLYQEAVFVVGLPRSGTTLVHNLLTKDPQFASPTTFQVGWPSSFLSMERFKDYWPLNSVLSETRPMDNVLLYWDLPQEDEIATTVLSGGRSSYVATACLANWRDFMTFIRFEDANPGDFRRWRDAFFWFVKKLRVLHGPNKRLLLKSPCHTGRVALFDKMYNGRARFIFVHRHPDEVFRSSWRAIVNRYCVPVMALQTCSARDSQEYVLGHHLLLHDSYMKDTAQLRPDQHVCVSYEDLMNDPVSAMMRVYDTLGLEGFESAREQFSKAKLEMDAFQSNDFPRVSPHEKAVVRREWGTLFADLGYSKE